MVREDFTIKEKNWDTGAKIITDRQLTFWASLITFVLASQFHVYILWGLIRYCEMFANLRLKL